MTETLERSWQVAPLAGPETVLRLVPAEGVTAHVLLWRALIGAHRDDDIEQFMIRHRESLSVDAAQAGVSLRDLETQVRLHLPSFRRDELWQLEDDDVYDKIRLPSVIRSSAIKEAREEAEFYAYASFLMGGEIVRRDHSVTRADGTYRRLRFGYVPPGVGQFYQTKLHYLRSARCDTSLELGLYLDGARYPLTYLSFSVCDRPYLVSALHEAGIPAKRNEILVLTRMYGLPRIPRNMMSLSISRAARIIKKCTPFRYIVTAFNPLLGFNGTTFLAAGFVPFATAPVTYSYNSHRMFSTRRQSGDCLSQRLDTPNNILVTLGVDRAVRRSLLSVKRIAEISTSNYAIQTHAMTPQDTPTPGDAVWLQRLVEYRQLLEAAWSAETIHPGYATEDGPTTPSRGQCGVTSVWLARTLHTEYEVEATYCYGTLTIERPQLGNVDHHCWLEIGKSDDPSRIVIDLTCDQAEGLGSPILCEEYRKLAKRGVRYEARSRLEMNELDRDRVWKRFQALRTAVDSLRRDRYHEDSGLLSVV